MRSGALLALETREHQVWVDMFAPIVRRLRSHGFVGPRYHGLRGKLRYAYQELVGRVDVVLIATAASRLSPGPEHPQLTLQFFHSWDEFAAFASLVDREYYAGFTERWRPAFGWGEQLVLARVGDKIAGFRWVQRGGAGMLCHFTPILEGEYRICRGGVLPSFRRGGVNTAFHIALLDELFSRGATRVYADCTKDNVASLRSVMRAGYRPVGEIYVPGRLRRNRGVTWSPATLPALDVEQRSPTRAQDARV